MPERDIHLCSANTLVDELQSELNEPRIVQLATGYSETTSGTATSGIRWAKLDAIKRIEELRPELQTKPFTDVCRLFYRDVPVIDPLAS